MGKTYRKFITNKHEKQKLNNLKKRQMKEEQENEFFEEDEELRKMREENGTGKSE